jgi:hypothetical protein
MQNINPEDYYMTTAEVQEYLAVSRIRVAQLREAGLIKQLKGAMYDTASVEAYKLKRGDKKGGRYPKE